jgi:ubiquinone/menaquinone biosynthesis C-methylase UbiE
VISPERRVGTERQQREIAFWRDRAAQQIEDLVFEFDRVGAPVSIQHYRTEPFYWWNAYWTILFQARALDLPHCRVLVIGAGFGRDAITLKLFGAKSVDAIDLSEECCRVGRDKAALSGAPVAFHTSSAEALPFADASFDVVYLNDIVHHLDILQAMFEIRRVVCPGGWVLGNEPYTHPWLQAVRNSHFVCNFLYPRMVKAIYGVNSGHISPDERKLDIHDLDAIEAALSLREIRYFNIIASRLVRPRGTLLPKIETLILRIPLLGRLLAGRIVFAAQV